MFRDGLSVAAVPRSSAIWLQGLQGLLEVICVSVQVANAFCLRWLIFPSLTIAPPNSRADHF